MTTQAPLTPAAITDLATRDARVRQALRAYVDLRARERQEDTRRAASIAVRVVAAVTGDKARAALRQKTCAAFGAAVDAVTEALGVRQSDPRAHLLQVTLDVAGCVAGYALCALEAEEAP